MDQDEVNRILLLLREALSDLEYVREKLALLPLRTRLEGEGGKPPSAIRRELVDRLAGAESALRQALEPVGVELDADGSRR